MKNKKIDLFVFIAMILVLYYGVSAWQSFIVKRQKETLKTMIQREILDSPCCPACLDHQAEEQDSLDVRMRTRAHTD